MATRIHPTAVVAKEAHIADGVEIGPYSLIGPHVKIGTASRLLGHVVVQGHTQIGARCEISYGACLGMTPQDRKHKGEASYLLIGDDNLIREHVTMALGSAAGAKTVIGNRNFFMTASHVGHDCVIGNDTTIVNNVALGGYVTVEDSAVIGGLAGVHQFCRIGKYSIVGGLSKIVMDVPPFSMVDGNPGMVQGINSVGLRRAGFNSSQLTNLKKAVKILFMSGNSLTRSLEKLPSEVDMNEMIEYLIEFTKHSKRGVARKLSETTDVV